MKTALIIASLAVPAIVCAAQPDPHPAIQAMIARKLGLTQAQQAAAHQVIQAHGAALKAEHAALVQARTALLQALVDPQTSDAQLQTLESNASATHLALEREISQVVKEIAPGLSPAQIAGAAKLVTEVQQHLQSLHDWFVAPGLEGGAPTAQN